MESHSAGVSKYYTMKLYFYSFQGEIIFEWLFTREGVPFFAPT